MSAFENAISRAYWSGWLIGVVGFGIGIVIGWRLHS